MNVAVVKEEAHEGVCMTNYFVINLSMSYI